MTIPELIKDGSASWQRAQPASSTAISQLTSAVKLELPDDYLTFLRHSNGGEGELGIDPGWFQIWAAEDVVGLNAGYEVAANVPGYLAFGSSLGGDLLAFDTRGYKPWPVVMVPCIGMEPDSVQQIADEFAKFAQSLGRPYGTFRGESLSN
jgi:hypothetical protein